MSRTLRAIQLSLIGAGTGLMAGYTAAAGGGSNPWAVGAVAGVTAMCLCSLIDHPSNGGQR